MDQLSVPAALLAPAAAAVAYLIPGRPFRRVLAGIVAIAGLAAAGHVVMEAYRGHPLVWRSLRGDLFPATVLASLDVAALVAGLRAATLRGRAERLGVVAVGVGTTAAGITLLATTVPVLALFAAVPTLAVLVASLTGGPRALSATGLVGLAAADVLVLAGLTLLVQRTDSTLLLAGTGLNLPGWLLLAGAALKLGIVPFAGTWGLGTGDGPEALAQVAVRGQGLALVAVVGLVLRGSAGSDLLVAAAAALALACGLGALVPGRGASGAAGVGGAATLVALGLGGTVGTAAFVLLAPVLPLAWAATWAAFAGRDAGRPSWRAVAAAGGGLALVTLLLLPPAGGFPGGWLASAVAASRFPAEPAYLAAVAALALGAAAGAFGAARHLRAVRASPTAIAPLIVGLASLYAGSASGRLAIGWLVRVENGLGLPALLPASGAPSIPPWPASRAAFAVVPAIVLVLAAVVVAGGLRLRGLARSAVDAPASEPSALGPPAERERLRPGVSPAEQVRFVVLAVGRALRRAYRAVAVVRARGYAYAVVVLGEAAAAIAALRLVVLATQRGFL